MTWMVLLPAPPTGSTVKPYSLANALSSFRDAGSGPWALAKAARVSCVPGLPSVLVAMGCFVRSMTVTVRVLLFAGGLGAVGNFDGVAVKGAFSLPGRTTRGCEANFDAAAMMYSPKKS